MAQATKAHIESYSDLHNPFATDMDSLFTFVDIVSPAVIEHNAETTRKLNRLKRELALVEKKASKSEEDIKRRMDAVKQIYRTDHPIGKHLTHGGLILAVSYFENHAKNLFHSFYKQFPSALPSNTTLDADQIRQATTIEEAQDLLRFGPVKSVLDQSVWEWRAFIANKIKIDLSPVDELFTSLIEIHARRNLLVHNGGIVDAQYMKKVSPAYTASNKIQLGERIGVSITYLRDAIETVYVIGVYLIQACWRKWHSDDLAVVNFYLNNQVYDALFDKKYKLVEKFYSAFKGLPKMDPSLAQILKVNQCIAYREMGRTDLMKNAMQSFKWTLDRPRIALAYAVLEERFDEVSELFMACKSEAPIKETEFKEWPLFIPLRRDPEFIKWAKQNLFNS